MLARIAKEVIQQAVQRQADVSAAMADRLIMHWVTQLWREQAAWRQARPTIGGPAHRRSGSGSGPNLTLRKTLV